MGDPKVTFPGVVVLPGEEAAIAQAVAIGGEWGYGNLICRLQEAWGRRLKDKWGVGDGSPHPWGGYAYDDYKRELKALEDKLAEVVVDVSTLQSEVRRLAAELAAGSVPAGKWTPDSWEAMVSEDARPAMGMAPRPKPQPKRNHK